MEQIPYMSIKRSFAILFSIFALLFAQAGFAKSHADFVKDVRALQNDLEIAYGYENAFSKNTLQRVIISIGEAQALLRDIMQTPSNQLSDDEKEDLYGQIIRGDEKVDYRGSLARVLWGTMPDRGDRFVLFVKNFYDDFKALLNLKKADWAGMHVAVNDPAKGKAAGDKIATDLPVTRVSARESRHNQEMLTRNTIVRMFDIYDLANDLEKNDRNFGYLSTQLEKIGSETDRNHFEVVAAERLSIALYASMFGVNFIGNYILPGVQFDWVGTLHQLFTHGSLSETPWGTAILSGASYLVGYGTLLFYKWRNRSNRDFVMMKEFLRALEDVTADLDEKDKDYDAKRKKAMDEHKKFVDSIRNGTSVLGQHRAKMIQAGYDPKKPESCERWMDQLFL